MAQISNVLFICYFDTDEYDEASLQVYLHMPHVFESQLRIWNKMIMIFFAYFYNLFVFSLLKTTLGSKSEKVQI